MTVDKITTSDQGGPLAIGSKRIVISLALNNTTSSTIEFSPGLSLTLVGNDNVAHVPTMKFSGPSEVKGGPIMPGNSMSLDLDFEIPQSSLVEYLNYQKDSSSSLVKINL